MNKLVTSAIVATLLFCVGSTNAETGNDAPPLQNSDRSIANIVEPCFSGVCLGDDVLGTIDKGGWENLSDFVKGRNYSEGYCRIVVLGGSDTKCNPKYWVEGKRKTDPGIKAADEYVDRYVRGNLSADEILTLKDYIATQSFDSRLLKIIRDKKPTFCRPLPNSLIGTSKGGGSHVTSVYAYLEPNGIFKVRAMKRKWNTGDAAETVLFNKALCAKYDFTCNVPGFGVEGGASYKNTPFYYSYSRRDQTLSFSPNSKDAEPSATLWAQQNGCGDTVKQPQI